MIFGQNLVMYFEREYQSNKSVICSIYHFYLFHLDIKTCKKWTYSSTFCKFSILKNYFRTIENSAQIRFSSDTQWWISLKAHKACVWSIKFLKAALNGKFLKIFLIIIENFYNLVKIKETLGASAFEFRLRALCIVHLREIAKFFPFLRVLRILGENAFGSKIR